MSQQTTPVFQYNKGEGRIHHEEYPYHDLPAVHLWVPEREPKPPEGYLFNDGLDCWVSWFDGMGLKEAVEVYWMEFQVTQSKKAREAHEKDPSQPQYNWERDKTRTTIVHAQTEDGVVHVFEVNEVWRCETEAKERKP